MSDADVLPNPAGGLDLVAAYLREVARRAHRLLGEVAGVGVTTAAHGSAVTTGASTGLAESVGRVETRLGRGPGRTALQGRRPTYAPDLARDARWGRYGPAAAEQGARSCLFVPVLGAGGPTGVVAVYADRVDGLTDSQRRLGRQAAREAAGGVTVADTLVTTWLELADRVEAMETRRAIDLATGVLMGRLGCGADEAFDLLRQQSQGRGLKVRDVAATLLGRPTGDAPFLPRGEPPARGR